MTKGKGLKRLAFFVVFFIPVGWYLFLQLFGDNTFKLMLEEEARAGCHEFEEISIVHQIDSVKSTQQNYFDRVVYRSNDLGVSFFLDTLNFFDCLQNDKDLLLVNKEGLWGAYQLDREGVDQLLTELDILLIQKSYGKGTSR